MTVEERVAVLRCLWRGVEQLIPKSRGHRARFAELYTAIEATYNDHGDARQVAGYDAGHRDAMLELEAVKRQALEAGMIAVQKRSDYRDLEDIKDPEELRQVH